MNSVDLESRISSLEAQVAALNNQLALLTTGDAAIPWSERIAGSFPDDALTRQAEKYGRQYRESLRPKSARKSKKKNGGARHGSRHTAASRGKRRVNKAA